VPAAERRRQELSTELTTGKLTDTERAPKTRELRELVAGMATAGERQAMQDAPLEEHREVFGLTVPDERVMPKAWREEYETEYGGHESDFLLAARQHGLDSKLVGELRDTGIRMAIEAEGKPVSDEAWAATAKRFEGRLTKEQLTALRKWWRSNVERPA